MLGRTTRGVAESLGYERRLGSATSRFTLRLASDDRASGGHTITPAAAGAPGAEPLPGFAPPGTPLRRTITLAGVGLFGVWNVPALGPVRAYVLARGGVYHYHAANQAQPSGQSAFIYGVSERQETNSLGYGGGSGARCGSGPSARLPSCACCSSTDCTAPA